MAINFNTEPYYDDFDETKKFYRILYRPSYAVQARELTQMQTILQNQISRFGDHVFKEGAMVIPGQVSIDTDIAYVKLEPAYASVLSDTVVEDLVGMTIENATGLQAEVIHYSKSAGADPATLFVRYKNSGTSTTEKTFAAGDVISDVDTTYTIQAAASDPVGKGSIATITIGVYYIKGHFVLVEPQTIILDKYTNTPSYRIGLFCEESIVTAEEDESLFDNAQNSFNYAAPGAHRYSITATLTKLTEVSTADTDFIELVRTGDGQVKREVRRTEYSVLEETFARRTYDESGNYTVKNFEIDIREYRDNNRGAWASSRVYLTGDVVTRVGNIYVARNSAQSSSTTPPSHTAGAVYDGPGNTGVQWEYTTTPYYNRGIYAPGNSDTLLQNQTAEAKLAIGLEPGKAYVQGYEIEKISTEYVPVEKSREYVQVENAYIPSTVGNYLLVTNVNSLPPVDTFGEVTLYDRATPSVGNFPPLSTVAATVAISGSAGQFTCGNSILDVGDTITITGTKGGTSTFTGYVSGTTYRVSSVTGTSPSVTGFTLTTMTGTALSTSAGTLTGLTYTATGSVAVGTARVRLIEWHNGTIGTQTAIYKLGLFDIKMNGTYDFNRKVKSAFFNVSSDANLSFSADIEPVLTRLIGSATASSSTTITGNGTSFQTDFIVGDVVSFGGTKRRITAIASQVSMTVDSSITINGSTIDRVSTEIKEPEHTSLIFPLPYYAIKDVRSALLANDTVYTVYEKFTGTATVSGSPQLTVSTASGNMASAAETDNYIVVDNDSGAGGAIVYPTGITASGSSVTFDLGSTYSGRSMMVIAAVNKSGAVLTEKSKTPVFSATTTFTTQTTAQNSTLLLGFADGYRLVSVKMKSGTFASPGATYSIDISDRYDFDNGQRSTHYDQARLVLKNSYAPPEAPIEVTFDYFTHSTGDYFTVNSYPANVDYKAIPYFQGQALRDCIDFRPRIDDAGTSFSGTGSSASLIPKRGIDIVTDFTYYLSRKSKVAVDFGGNFFAVDGVSSLNPGEPLDPALGLVLYNLTLEPYTFGTNSNNIQVGRIDNRRYTMRDIGKLEKRIDNLEYYTSLSLLEQQTESLDIIDSNGDSRFKNGFIVDGFTGHNTGDSLSPDYICSIDMERAELRPFYSMNNINLLEKNSNDSSRASSNYKLYGDVITLPLDATTPHVKLIEQPYASRLENINPFAVFTFLGDVKINPSSDDWFEVDRRPDLVIDIEGNYSTIKNIAERRGVLGTVWNAWQNSWTGSSVNTGRTKFTFGGEWASGFGDVRLSQAEVQARFGITGWGNARQITVESTATQVGQSRTGVKTSLVTKIDRQVVGDRVLSTAAIPFIRSRNILIQVQKLKPNTRFYPFFDNINIASYCTPASKITYTPVTGAFNTETNVGGLASGSARRINGDSQVCLNRGDVITGGTSGATAVVVGKEFNPDTNAYALFVVNIVGTFSSTETITGSVSAATGTVGTVTVASLGGNLVSNFNGDIQLLFNIPNTDALRFRCGTREFKLVDVSTADGDFTSRGRANYRAEGILETRQQTVHSVRNAELVEEQVSENRVIVQTSDRIVADTGWWDPLAQTFLIEQKGGCFLSKVDIFFATKDEKIPVMLEIREVVNGYPGKRVLPFSRVTLKPEQVSLSANTVTLDGVSVNKYDTATTFTFPSPVYVQENTEYCIVLASDSNAYKVWISQVGEQMPGTARTISEQPYLGSLFKSQNASTWTADQTQDLKFVLYRAKFNTSVQANVEYVNDLIPLQTLGTDPFETRFGQTKVRVWHDNHGMPSGSRVVISGVAAAVNGIPTAELNTTHVISDVDLDSYVITVTTTSATASGYGGGSAVKATRNMQYDAVQPAVQIQTFSETAVDFGIITTTGKSVDSTTQTAYVQQVPPFSGILANETNYFNAPRMIASEINETLSLGGNKSVTMNVTFSSTNNALSPILDTHRTSMIVINNKINEPSETNMNVAGLDDNVILNGLSGVTVAGNQITTSTRNAQFKTATVGKYLTIAGASSGSSTRLITAVASDGSSITFSAAPDAITGNATLTQRERFVDEIAPIESSSYSKYVTKTVNLANPSNYLRVRFAVNLPAEASVEVYYKTAVVGSTASFDNVPYTLMTVDAPIVNFSNGTERFVDASFSKADMEAFDAVKLKIVMKSDNSSEVPRIKDLRVIACA